MSEVKKGGGRDPRRNNNGASHVETQMPFSALLRSMAAKLEFEPPTPAPPKAIWGRYYTQPTTLTDEQVREIRRAYEWEKAKPRELMKRFGHLFGNKRQYLASILYYRTRSTIFPEDADGIRRK